MFEGTVQELLRKYLKEYLFVDDVALEQIAVSIWSGKLEIGNLDLQSDALHKLFGLDIKTRTSRVGKLKVSIPWTSLRSKPVVIELEDIDIVAFQSHLSEQKEHLQANHDEGKKKNDEKTKRLSQLEALESQGSEREISSGADVSEESKQNQSFAEKLGTMILNNLQLVLKNIHIRFEDDVRAFGVKIKEAALVSTNSSWEEAFVTESSGLFKLARLVDLSIYAGLLNGAQEPELYSQSRIIARLKLSKNSKDQTTKAVEVGIELSKSNISIRKSQVLALRGFSLQKPVNLTPRDRWKTAIGAVIQDRRKLRQEWKRLAWVSAHKDSYVSLFKRRLQATEGYLEDLSAAERAQLHTLENSPKMYFSDIVRFRKVAYEEVRLEVGDPAVQVQLRRASEHGGSTAKEQEEKEKKEKKTGWLSSWWYGTSDQNETETLADNEEPVQLNQPIVQISQEDRDQLFETIGYDPEAVDQAVTDFGAVQFLLQASIDSASIYVIDETTEGGQLETEVLSEVELGTVNLDLTFQSEIKALQLAAASLRITDTRTVETAFREIVAPTDGKTTTNLLNLSLERKTPGKPLTVDLKMEQALNIVQNPDFLETLLQVLNPPLPRLKETMPESSSSIPKHSNNSNVSGTTLETYQAAYSQVSVEDIWNEDTVPQVSLIFLAPTIILPRDPGQLDTDFLKAQLGLFKIGRQNAASSSEWFLKASDMSLQVVKPQSQNQKLHFLQDVSLNASLTMCNDRKELSKPRIAFALAIPKIKCNIPLKEALTVVDIVQSNAGSQAVQQQTQGRQPPFQQEHEVLDTTAEHAMTKHSSSSSSSMQQQKDSPSRALAERVSLHVNAHIEGIEMELSSPHLYLGVAVNETNVAYTARTFDSQLALSSRGITILDRNSQRYLLAVDNPSDAVFDFKLKSMMPPSPLFRGCSTCFDVRLGAITFLVSQKFLNDAAQTVDYFMSLNREVRTPNTQAKMETVAVTKTTTSVTKSAETTTTTSFSFSSDALRIQLEDVESVQVAEIYCGQFTSVFNSNSIELRLQDFSLNKGSEKTPLIWPMLSNHNSKPNDLIVVSWTVDTGYVVETDALYVVLDQGLFTKLTHFVPQVGTPRQHREYQEQPKSQPTKELERESTASEWRLVLRHPEQPFVLEFISSENLSCALEVNGVQAMGGAITLNTTKLVINKKERLALLNELVYDQANSHLKINTVELLFHPDSRSLFETAVTTIEHWIQNQLPSMFASSLPQEQQHGEETSNHQKSFSLDIQEIQLAIQDNGGNNPMVLQGRHFTFQESQVSIGSLCLRDKAKDSDELILRWPDALSSPVFHADLNATPVHVSFAGGLEYELTPESLAAFKTYLSLVVRTIGFINVLRVAMFPAPATVATVVDDASQEIQDSQAEMARIELDTVQLFVSPNRPRLQNLAMAGRKGTVSIHQNGFIKILFEQVDVAECMSSSVSVSMEWDQSSNLHIRLAFPGKEPSLDMSLSPSMLYTLNSILKYNILISSTKIPQYEHPKEGGGFITFSAECNKLVASVLSEDQNNNTLTSSSERSGSDRLALQKSGFATLQLSEFSFRYDGENNSITLAALSAKLFSPRFEPRSTFGFLLSEKLSLSWTTTESADNLVVTNAQIHSTKVRLRYHAKLIQTFFEYIADIERLRVQNMLAEELAEEDQYVPNRKHSARVEIDSLSLVVEGTSVASSGDSGPSLQLIEAFVARTGVVGLVDVAYNEADTDSVMQLSFQNSHVSFAFLNPKDFAIMREFPVVSDSEVMVKVSSCSTRLGVLLSRKILVIVERFYVSCLIPAIPEMAKALVRTLRERPSMRVVRQAILEQTQQHSRDQNTSNIDIDEELASFTFSSSSSTTSAAAAEEATAMGVSQTSYEVNVTVEQLELSAYGANNPVARVKVLNTSTVEGASEGSSSSIVDSRFKGDISVRTLTLECFNGRNLTWEPVIEPCELSCHVETIPHSVGNAGVKLAFRSSSSVRINLHPQHLEAVAVASYEGAQMLENVNEVLSEDDLPSTATHSTLVDSNLGVGEGKGGEHTCYIQNLVDAPVVCQGVTVGPGEIVSVRSTQMRVIASILEYTREVLLVPGNEQVIEPPFLAAYVERDTPGDGIDIVGIPFRITFASTTNVHNKTDLTLQVQLTTMDGKTEEDTPLPPRSNFFVPSRCGKECIVRFRFLPNDRWEGVRLSSESTSDEDAGGERVALVTMDESQKSLRVKVSKNAALRRTVVTLAPAKTIVNDLPETVTCRLFRRVNSALEHEAEITLQPGETHYEYAHDTGALYFVLHFPDTFPGATGQPKPLLDTAGTYKYHVQTENTRQRHQVRYSMTEESLRLFSPIWVVNATGLPLLYSVNNGNTLTGSGALASTSERVVEETWENQRKYLNRGWVPEMLLGERPAWSDANGDSDELRTKESFQLPPGWEWEGPWKVDPQQGLADPEGWRYATAFIAPSWDRSEGWSDVLRRRRWVRARVRKQASPVGSGNTPCNFVSGYGLDTDIQVAMVPSKGAIPLWSQSLALDLAVGSNNVFHLRRDPSDQSFYSLVVNVNRHSSFLETKVCTIAPRIILVNNVKAGTSALRCIQANSLQTPVDVDSSTPFFWFTPPKEPLLQIQVGTSNWSSPFSIDRLGETCIVVVEQTGRKLYLRVEIKRCVEVAGSMLVVFREEELEEPMYRIRNVSLDTLFVSQRDAQTSLVDPVTEIGPYSTAPFAWLEPSKPHLISLEFKGHPSFVFDIDITRVGAEKKVELPPRSLGDGHRGMNPDNLVMDGKQCLVSFADTANSALKWVASPPELKVQSILDDVDKSNATQGWQATVGKLQGTAVSFMCFESATGQAGSFLHYGDKVAIYCTSADGRQRVLGVKPLTLQERGAKVTSSPRHLEWKLNGKIIESGEFVEDENEPSEDCLFWIRGGEHGGALSERNGEFSLESLILEDFYIAVQSGVQRLELRKKVLAENPQQNVFVATHLSSMDNLPKRVVFISVDIEGKSRVIRVSETSLTQGQVTDESESGFLNSSSSSTSALSQPTEVLSVEEKTRLELSVELSDLGVSVISLKDPVTPFELLYMSLSIEAKLLDTNLNRSMDVFLHELRIDNDLPDATYVNLLKRGFDPHLSKGASKPVAHLKLYEKHTQLNVMYIQNVQLNASPIDVQLDEALIEEAIHALAAFSDASSSGAKSTRNTHGDKMYKLPDREMLALCERSMSDPQSGTGQFYVRSLELGKLELRFSFFKNQFTDVERAPIEFDPLSMGHIVASGPKLTEEIMVFYKAQVQRHILTIIGYSLPGNPGELISSLGGGEVSLGGFMKTAVRGVASIGTLGSTIAKIDKDYKKQRSGRPQNVGEGFAMGGEHIQKAVSQGFKDFLEKPVQGAEKGFLGAMSGFGSGVLGLMTKPVSGVASAVNAASQGFVAETKSREELHAERMGSIRIRSPRLCPASNKYRLLQQYRVLEDTVIRKGMQLLPAVKNVEKDWRAAQGSVWQDEGNGQIYLLDYFFSPLSYFLLHTQTHVAFGAYKLDENAVANLRRAGKLTTGELTPNEELKHKTIVQFFWVEHHFLNSVQPIEQAVQVWTEQLGEDKLSKCEAKLRQRASAKLSSMTSRGHPTPPNIKQLASSFASSFHFSKYPRFNMQVMLSLWDNVQITSGGDIQRSRKTLEQVLLHSMVWKELPLLTLSIVRAYFFGLDNKSSFRVDTSEYTSALMEFQQAFLAILTLAD